HGTEEVEGAAVRPPPPRLLSVVFSRSSLSRCIPIALFVGTVLSLINQGSVIFGGHATDATWIRVGFNYIVPFFVSSSGLFASQRSTWRATAPARRIAGDDPVTSTTVEGVAATGPSSQT